jgi:hypothetical protein
VLEQLAAGGLMSPATNASSTPTASAAPSAPAASCNSSAAALSCFRPRGHSRPSERGLGDPGSHATAGAAQQPRTRTPVTTATSRRAAINDQADRSRRHTPPSTMTRRAPDWLDAVRSPAAYRCSLARVDAWRTRPPTSRGRRRGRADRLPTDRHVSAWVAVQYCLRRQGVRDCT